MKKILILIIFSISVVNLFAQNSEPKAIPFVWGSSTLPRIFNPNDSMFSQTEFLTGYQWTGTPRFNRLMKNNANSGAASFDTNFERSQEPINISDLANGGFFTSFKMTNYETTP